MSKFENRNPIEIDSYTSRSKRVKSLYTADNIYANQTVANIVVLLCCAIDFLVLFSKWLLVTKPENTAIIVCIAVASSVALDVPLAIGGWMQCCYISYSIHMLPSFRFVNKRAFISTTRRKYGKYIGRNHKSEFIISK